MNTLHEWSPGDPSRLFYQMRQRRPLHDRAEGIVEDKVSTLADWAAAHPDGTGLVFGRAYKAGDEFRGQRVVRVNNWAEVVSLAEAVSSDDALRWLRGLGEP